MGNLIVPAQPLGEAIQVNLKQAGIEPPKDEAEQLQPIPASLNGGYYSAQAVEGLERLGFDPYIAAGCGGQRSGRLERVDR